MDSPSYKIAVHIVTYNDAGTIAACLSSLQQQTIPFDLHIIDNASEDGTAYCIQEMGYSVTQNPVNVGYSAAHNQALAATDAPYILTLNADARLMPDFLGQMVAAFEQYPNLGAQAGLLLRVDALGDEPYCVDSCGVFLQKTYRQRLRYEGCMVGDAPKEMQPIFGPDGAAAVYRRQMLESISVDGEVFDEDFFIQKEDIDICWRAQFRGWDALFNPAAEAHHIRGFRPGNRKMVDQQARYYGVRNRYLLLIKHGRWSLLWRYMLPMLFYDLGIFVYLLLFEQASLIALMDVLRTLPRLWRKRRVTRSRQIVSDSALLKWFTENTSCKQDLPI